MVQVASSDIGAVRIKIDFNREGDLVDDIKGYTRDIEFHKDFKKNEDLINVLKSYLNGDNPEMDMPWDIPGTPFMHDVWESTCKIPYGETKNYSDIALTAGRPKAARAVGQALNRNPLLIIIPCHRVVSVSGIGGFGSGIDMKRYLLNIEGSFINFQGRI
jgi:O-6-methylguanine DNA methyltransferase